MKMCYKGLSEKVDRALAATTLAISVLDPCLFWLVKAAWERTSDLVWVLVNHSLREGVARLALKKALVHPLQKRPLLDPTSFDNFCQASNLPFLGNVEMIFSWHM